MVLLSAKSHHELHASTIVPTAIKNNDFTSCGKVLEITLHKHLRLLAIGGCWGRHNSEHTWTNAFCDGFDGAAFAGGVTSFKHDNDPKSLLLYPILQTT